MDQEERTLIQQAQKRNIHAFELLIKKYDQQVLKLCFDFVHNQEDALDMAQEIFIKLFHHIHRFNFRSEFSTWLYRVVINYCINYSKKKKRIAHQETILPENHTCEALLKNPEEDFLNKELSEKIKYAIEKLPAQQRTVFLLRHYHGHKLREIAQIMQCTEGTVKNYLFRATQKMQKLLKFYVEI